MKTINKKGMLFGIDARITLAVITIISAIGYYFAKDKILEFQQQNFVEQVVTLREAAKQNIIDNGGDFSIGATNLNDNLFGLADENPNSLTVGRNKHAYITEPNYAAAANQITISTPTGNINIDAKNLYASTAANGTSSAITDCTETSSTCFYWIKLTNVPKEYYTLIEEHYDGLITNVDATTTGIIVAPNQTIDTFTGNIMVNVGRR